MEPVTIKLTNPIVQGSETITSLTFPGSLKGRHVRDMPLTSQMTAGDLLKIASRMCGEPPSVMDELEGADLMDVLSLVGGFLQPGQKTGS